MSNQAMKLTELAFAMEQAKKADEVLVFLRNFLGTYLYEKDVCSASMGMWAAMKVTQDECAIENANLRAALERAKDELYTISCATRFGDSIQSANADAAKRVLAEIEKLERGGE